MSVPLPLSPGRGGFGPDLSLSYDSGSGNGPFGFGWSLSLPRISRKTDDGLPRYRDREASDVFVLSGAEDLVPVLRDDGTRFEDRTQAPGYVVHRYRPRVEGLFARIERWTETSTGEVHWRSISRDNVTRVYGRDRRSRILDPAEQDILHPRRVFEWLVCEAYDDKGNAVVYEYAEEDARGVDVTRAPERDRQRGAQRYLLRVKYGNRVSRLVEPDLSAAEWLFELLFDYDAGHYVELPLDPNVDEGAQHRLVQASVATDGSWRARPDPFSVYRPGFEVRTHRRCRRVLVFHRFDELGPDPCLVRSLELDYADLEAPAPPTVDEELGHSGSTRFGSFLCAITQSGYVRREDRPVEVRGGARYATYLRRCLPPVELEYSRARVQGDVRRLDEDSREHLPAGVDGRHHQWVDLDGEGLAGVLTQRAGAWHYKPNLGEGRLGADLPLAQQPALATVGDGSARLVDLSGDGQLDVLTLAGPLAGFYERTSDRGWAPFRALEQVPNVDWDDPNLRLVDLNGDGRADVLVTEQDVFTWYPSRGEDGFDAARRVPKPWDAEGAAQLVFSDGTQSLYLADMSGDGLSDLVRIENGRVCYWPNLGYGRFGRQVVMEGAPVFDRPEQFRQDRLRIADIDGSGPNDILYLGQDEIRVYFNRAGNSWSEARLLPRLPHLDDLSTVRIVDLLGNGTACLVWSSPLPADAQDPLRYIDLMGGQKPSLLIRMRNNLGAETVVTYAPSTKFYLQDMREGRPWITRIPFPVHVVERVETYDHVSRSRFVSRFSYHHGHYDGRERELRGFGLVERRDTEELSALRRSAELPTGDNVEAASYVPPVLTKTWYHTGIHLGRDQVSDYFAGLLDTRDTGEYFREPGLSDAAARALLLGDTILPAGLSEEEAREACRALRGSVLRTEVYALDGGPKASLPYSVTERSYTVKRLQPKADQRHAVFLAHDREALAYHYERSEVFVLGGQLVDAATAAVSPGVETRLDPRTTHNLTLEVDDHGNVRKSASVGYGRRFVDSSLPAPARDAQAQTHVTYSEGRWTEAVSGDDDHRGPALYESRTYELTGFTPSGPAGRFVAEDLVQPDPAHPGRLAAAFDSEIAYEASPTGGRQRRLVEHTRTVFRRDDLTGALELGRQGALGLVFERYRLAFTAGLVEAAFNEGGATTRVTDAMLGGVGPAGGGYVHGRDETGALDADWWIPSGRVLLSPGAEDTTGQELAYAQAHFFRPCRLRDPFHAPDAATESVVTYDGYDLLAQETRDALGNRMTVGERDPDPTRPLVRGGHDYRVLQPALVMDPNRNCTAVAFDAFGDVAGTAVMGKPEDAPQLGDRLTAAFSADLTRVERSQLLADPTGAVAAQLLRDATTRIVTDPTAWWRDAAGGSPIFVVTLARDTHYADPAPPGGPKIHVDVSYSDGFGREVQKKLRAEDGPVPVRDADGGVVLDASGQPEMTAHDVSPRWVGSGWTVFDNKGKPVRQFEPFFTHTHELERDVRVGKSPVRFYDPVSRVVGTLHPDRTWEKVVFGPWGQVTWDVSDTVEITDPRADPDVGSAFSRLLDEEHTPSWYALRTDPAHAAELAARYPSPTQQAHERSAAVASEIYARTPIAAHADSLGRSVLTVAHNRFEHSTASAPTEERYSTRVVYDVEGNQREIVDAKQRVAMRYAYDMLGRRIRQSSMEAGRRWTLDDAAGKELYAWDDAGARFRTTYDALRRPTGTHLLVGGAEILLGRSVYGESEPNPEVANLRGQLVELYDQAGVVTRALFDFKGNLMTRRRRLVDTVEVAGQPAPAYKNRVDWSAPVTLSAAVYESRTRYDALNRPVQLVPPHAVGGGATIDVIQPRFNDANLLERIDVWLDRGQVPAQLLDPAAVAPSPVGIEDIDYDAKGQRVRVAYKATAPSRQVTTHYRYDPQTFRLTRIYTRRGAAFTADCRNPAPPPDTTVAPEAVEDVPEGGACGLQNLHYTYDVAGNIVRVRDDAQPTIFFAGARVSPSMELTYDAVFRLIEARGREHLGQVGGPPIPHSYDDAARVGRQGIPHPNDGQAFGRYIERYFYDQVGNILSMRHAGLDPAHAGWSRTYAYDEPSLLEPGRSSNRLTATQVFGGLAAEYSDAGDGYDARGNMTRMPHLAALEWNESGQLRMTQRQAIDGADVNGGPRHGQRTWYVYDAEGARVRKVTERANGAVEDERIYLDGLEIYRRPDDGLERRTLHLMDEEQRIARVETRTAGNEPGVPRQLVSYQLDNHLGSAVLEVDNRAQVVSYEEYSPYGSTVYQAVSSQVQVPKRYRYSGMERDEESGLNYHAARYYAPWLGRWVSPEPRGFVDTPNLYQFVRGNPVGLRDQTGHIPDNAVGDRMFDRMVGVPPPPPPRPPDPLVQAARLHGQVQGRLQTLERELQELYTSRVQQAPVRFWNLEHVMAASGFSEPFTERRQMIEEMVQAGVAEEGAVRWHSTVLEQAIENEVITSRQDQERFLRIAERERRSVIVRWALWRAAEMALALTPVRGAGAGGMLLARAPHSTSAALTALNRAARATGIRGRYVNVVENMSARAIRFQELVSGGIRAGTSFLRNGVKFDFLDTARRLLIDAKGPGYANFVNRAGDFYSWFRGRQTLVDQATRQIRAAAGERIEWVFAEQRALDATRRLFQSQPASSPIRQALASGQLSLRLH